MTKIRMIVEAPGDRGLEAFAAFLAGVREIGPDKVDSLGVGELRGMHAAFWEAFDAAQSAGSDTFAFNPKRDDAGRFAPGGGPMDKADDDEDGDNPDGKARTEGQDTKRYLDEAGQDRIPDGKARTEGQDTKRYRDEAWQTRKPDGKDKKPDKPRFEDEDERGQPLDEERGRRRAGGK